MIAKSFYFSNAPKYKLGKVINAREISGLGLDFVKIDLGFVLVSDVRPTNWSILETE